MFLPFFSPAGRTSPVRLASWGIVALVLLWAGARALQVGDLAIFLLVGALWGAVAAKLGVEAARRMHDCGRRGLTALPAIGVAAFVFLLSMGRWLSSGPDVLFTVSIVAIALWLGIMFLRPGNGDVNYRPAPSGGRAGALLAAALVLLGAGVGYGLFSWSEGVRRVHEDSARHAAAYQPGPDPLADEYNAQGGRR